jgi:hypothetical protein
MFERMCCSLFFSFVFAVGTWDVLKGNLVPVASILREKRSVNYLKVVSSFYTLHYLHTSSIIEWKNLGTRLEYDIGQQPMGENPNFHALFVCNEITLVSWLIRHQLYYFQKL